MCRRRQFGAPAPEVDLRRGWFLTQIGAADRGGQLDLKIVRGLLQGLSALHNTATAGPLVEKYQATVKPNARRMECDCEGASEMMVALASIGVRGLLVVTTAIAAVSHTNFNALWVAFQSQPASLLEFRSGGRLEPRHSSCLCQYQEPKREIFHEFLGGGDFWSCRLPIPSAAADSGRLASIFNSTGRLAPQY